MRLLDASNAEPYLRETGRVEPRDVVQITPLSGGVSNEVLYVAFAQAPHRDFVLKQAREQLRVADPWFCGVDRIWREVEVLRVCQRVLAKRPDVTARTPGILWEDRENYCFAMEAAPRDHVVWKQQLLTGHVDEEIASQCGQLLGALHAGTWGDADLATSLRDRRIFDELRLDPYYRTLASRRPEVASRLTELIDSVLSHPLCLVHADFSPKNLLVYEGSSIGGGLMGGGLMMVDFETGHFGDPAFDLGFFLTHLVLKAIYHAPRHEPFLALTERFWAAYQAELSGVVPEDEYCALVTRGIQNLAGCAWARLDGKSPVEYLTDPRRCEQVRESCRRLLEAQPLDWNEFLSRIEWSLMR
jgi:aminoglycoside phosphotransferase (APT) family kinase protein